MKVLSAKIAVKPLKSIQNEVQEIIVLFVYIQNI